MTPIICAARGPRPLRRSAATAVASGAFAAASLFGPLSAVAQESGACVRTFEFEIQAAETETVRTTDIREALDPFSVTLDPRDPNDLEVYFVGRHAAGTCNLIIDAVDRGKGDRANLLFSVPLNDDDDVRDGGRYERVVGDVRYVLQIEECEGSIPFVSTGDLRFSVTVDLSRADPEACGDRAVDEDAEAGPAVLTWRMTGFVREQRLGPPELVRVTPGANPTIGLSIDRRVGLNLGAVEATANVALGALQEQIEGRVDRAQAALFSQGLTSSYAVTLDGAVCDAWVIRRSQTVELGEVTAPRYGVTEPLEFTVVLSQRIDAQPLCAEGETRARAEAITAFEASLSE